MILWVERARRGPYEMVNGLTPNGKPRAFVGHQPLTLSGADLELYQQRSPQIE